jgi:hypothetical protein
MGDWNNLYPSRVSVTTSSLAPIETSLESIDLRSEFDWLIYGDNGETPIGQSFILRRMRRDSNGDLVPCYCLDELTQEPDRDYPCQYCAGRGWLWDEELITGYKVIAASPGGSNAEVNMQKTPAGKMYVPAARIYFSYDSDLTIDDRVVELELDPSGNAVTPYSRVVIYELTLVRAMRGDDAAIAFWVANCQTMGPETQGLVG